MKKIVIVVILLCAGYVFGKINLADIKNKVMQLANAESSDTVSVSVGKAGQIEIDGNKISIDVIEIVRRSDGEGAIFMVGEIKARKKVGGRIPLTVNSSTYTLELVSGSGNSAKFRVVKGEMK